MAAIATTSGEAVPQVIHTLFKNRFFSGHFRDICRQVANELSTRSTPLAPAVFLDTVWCLSDRHTKDPFVWRSVLDHFKKHTEAFSFEDTLHASLLAAAVGRCYEPAVLKRLSEGFIVKPDRDARTAKEISVFLQLLDSVGIQNKQILAAVTSCFRRHFTSVSARDLVLIADLHNPSRLA